MNDTGPKRPDHPLEEAREFIMRTVNKSKFGKYVRIATALVVLTLLVPAVGSGQGTKIGTVDLQTVVEESADWAKAAEDWTAILNERSADFQAGQAEIDLEQAKLDTQPSTLTEVERAAVARNIDRLGTQLTRLNEDIQIELDSYREDLMGPIAEKANRLIREYALEAGFNLIIDGSNPNSGVAFVDEVIDITTEMLRRMDAPSEETPPGPGPGPGR